MKAPVVVTYMPHAAHFICAKDCRFFLATHVNGYVVSTVGEYWPERVVREIHAEVHDMAWLTANKSRLGDEFDQAYMNRFGYEQIGCDRTYETMVFHAAWSHLKCCPYVIANGNNIDFDGYNDPGDAALGHRKMVARYAKRKPRPLQERER